MEEWKTLKVETIDVGGNNFLEVNIKQPPNAEGVLYGISKGWYNDKSEKRYKANILFSKEGKADLIKVLQSIDE